MPKQGNPSAKNLLQQLRLLLTPLVSKTGIITATVFTGCVLALTHTAVISGIEQTSGLRWLFHWRGPVNPPAEVAIVSINQQAASNLQYPQHLIRWNRQTYAQLVNKLRAAGAATLVFDIAFLEPRPAQDAELAEALREHGKVILFNYLKRSQTLLKNQAVLDIEQQLPPPEPLRSAAAGYASFTLPKFPAHIVSTPLWHEHSGGTELTQPLLALSVYFRSHLKQFAEISQSINGPDAIQHAPADTDVINYILQLHSAMLENPHLQSAFEQELQSTPELRLLLPLFTAICSVQPHTINFYGPPGTLRTIPIDEVFNSDDTQLRAVFQDKVVYIGLAETAQTEQQDAYRTVYTLDTGVDLSGVEISATVFANLLRGDRIKPSSPLLQTAILVTACVISTFALLTLSLRLSLLTITLTLAGYFWLAATLFSRYNLWLPLSTPLLMLLLGGALALYLRLVMHRQRQLNTQAALAKYLPDDIAEALSFNVSTLESQHRLVNGVCLMTDIHGYTAVSEQLAPTELHKRLNNYYSKLITVVNEHGGAVANIVGDSLLAVWTSDKLTMEVCNTALATACKMIETLRRTEDDEDNFPTSIALHCGEFSFGHLGAQNHFEYAPVGDIVNTTSRIEQLNRKLGTQILCSAPFVRVRGEQGMRYRGDFKLRNKQQPLAIYEYNNP